MSLVAVHPDRKTPSVRPLKAYRHMQAVLANKEDTEQVFHVIEALNGDSVVRRFRAFAATEAGQRELDKMTYLPPILDDHSWIEALPEGTVGRSYVDFMQREGLSAQGLVDENEKFRETEVEHFDDQLEWYLNRVRDTHDMFHILTGYGRDALGEAGVLAFTNGQMGGNGLLFVAYMAAREVRKSLPAGRPMKVFWEARRAGKKAELIMMEDIEALLREPLDEARARLGIPEPTAYQRALQVASDVGIQAGDIGVTA